MARALAGRADRKNADKKVPGPRIRIYQSVGEFDTEWTLSAACRGMETEIFWADGRLDLFDLSIARKTCAGCPVRVECLTVGLREKQGIYGRFRPRERKQVVELLARGVEVERAIELMDKRVDIVDKRMSRRWELDVDLLAIDNEMARETKVSEYGG